MNGEKYLCTIRTGHVELVKDRKFEEQAMLRKEDIVYLARFGKGSGVMGFVGRDFYATPNGNIIQHTWANGGEDRKKVKAVPDSIPGYTRLTGNEQGCYVERSK